MYKLTEFRENFTRMREKYPPKNYNLQLQNFLITFALY
jgi:hypothetical protein